MKRTTILLFFLTICSLTAISQTKDYFKINKHEIRLSYGSVNDDNYYDRFYSTVGYPYSYGSYYYGSYYGYIGSRYSGYFNYTGAMYYSGPTKTTGVFGLSYLYNMAKIRLSFGGIISYSGYNTDIKERLTQTKVGYVKGHNLAITPTIRYAWLSKEKFRLYSGFGLSFYWDMARRNYPQGKDEAAFKVNQTDFDTAFQLTPIGFSFGKDIFVFGEANLGGRTGTFVGGIGYRF